ncbi:NAD-P-binding protein [Vararia minispora EC-137]|uniref:NAD-P-binding protein n=1 Tax=Vararia minispora EC-137 TaxID=1314806 RepID=A0ACB8QLX0_9AGAM|nr:NAD-P-binding protein [Vararia minispora EC-137]
MSTNAAWRFPSPGAGISALRKVSESRPTPEPHQYLVRIRAVSLNYRDVGIIAGGFVMPAKENLILGGDLAGEIVEVGSSATKFKVGDHVTSISNLEYYYGPLVGSFPALGRSVDGALQEYRAFDEMALIRSPSYLSYEELSCFPIAGVTAWTALLGGSSPLRPGQTALLQGTGGVSMFGLQIARAAGAKTVITSSSDEKLELAKKLGATHVVNYKKTPAWDEEVKRVTNGVGAHQIIDIVGVSEIERCFGAVAYGGTINSLGVVGGISSSKLVNVPLLAMKTGSQLRGTVIGPKQHFEELLAFAEVHEIRPYISKIFEFGQVPEAFEYLKSGQHFGKVVVRIGSE